jgi:hypothetical protein
VLPQRAIRVVPRLHAGLEFQHPADVLGHRRRHLRQSGEIPQPLAGLQQHQQGQQVLRRPGLLPRPGDLPGRRRERLVQLPHRHHPLEPRVRRPLDRRHEATTWPATSKTLAPVQTLTSPAGPTPGYCRFPAYSGRTRSSRLAQAQLHPPDRGQVAALDRAGPSSRHGQRVVRGHVERQSPLLIGRPFIEARPTRCPGERDPASPPSRPVSVGVQYGIGQ